MHYLYNPFLFWQANRQSFIMMKQESLIKLLLDKGLPFPQCFLKLTPFLKQQPYI